jgi:hypothetical protein
MRIATIICYRLQNPRRYRDDPLSVVQVDGICPQYHGANRLQILSHSLAEEMHVDLHVRPKDVVLPVLQSRDT